MNGGIFFSNARSKSPAIHNRMIILANSHLMFYLSQNDIFLWILEKYLIMPRFVRIREPSREAWTPKKMIVSDTNKSWQPRREFSSPERNVSPNIPHIYVYGSQDAGSALKSQTGPPQEGPDKKLSKGEQTSDPKTQNWNVCVTKQKMSSQNLQSVTTNSKRKSLTT